MSGKGGRPAIFQPKSGVRVHGVVTEEGRVRFEQARQQLAEIVGWPVARVSDGDTVEFLARGERAARRYIAERFK